MDLDMPGAPWHGGSGFRLRAGRAAAETAAAQTREPARDPSSPSSSFSTWTPRSTREHVRIAPGHRRHLRGTRHPRAPSVPAGADWITQVSGHSSLDVRITLDTDDGEVIYMTYTGIVSRGDGGLYWRVRPVFSTASEKYDWLNHAVFVGKNKQVEGKVAYDIFRVL